MDLSGQLVTVSMAAAQATAVLVIVPAAAVVDTDFLSSTNPSPGWSEWEGTLIKRCESVQLEPINVALKSSTLINSRPTRSLSFSLAPA